MKVLYLLAAVMCIALVVSVSVGAQLPTLMRSRLIALWALIALPFILGIAIGGPTGLLPHALFHPIFIAFAIGAIPALLVFRSATDSRLLSGLALGLIISQAAAIAGQVGEEIAVLQHGGLSAGTDVFLDPVHQSSAFVTILPGYLTSQILLIVFTVVAIRAGRRRAFSTPYPPFET